MMQPMMSSQAMPIEATSPQEMYGYTHRDHSDLSSSFGMHPHGRAYAYDGQHRANQAASIPHASRQHLSQASDYHRGASYGYSPPRFAATQDPRDDAPFPRNANFWRAAPHIYPSAGATATSSYEQYPSGYHDAHYRYPGEASRGRVMNAQPCNALEQQPTYVGHIKSAQDAILLLAACDLPEDVGKDGEQARYGAQQQRCPPPRRVTRRLLDAERGDLVSSGCVFAWDEKEAGMRRWTDGRVWSASRVSGCFLTYRELEARKKANGSLHDGPTANQYKADGLIKQSFSVTTASGRKLHVISYFTKRDVREGRLRRVSEDPRFVGESGGEWGLRVDENEYVLRESQPHGADGQDDGGMMGQSGRTLQSGSSISSSSQDGGEQDQRMTMATAQPLAMPAYPRKRSLEQYKEGPRSIAHVPIKHRRPSPRPLMTRKRSSSLDTPRSFNDTRFNNSSSSFESAASSSLNTTVPSESEEGRGGMSKQGSTLSVSPSFPRESALRNSACEMRPTDSQESANAIGALLSLAGGNSARETTAVRPAVTSSESPLRKKSLDISKMATANALPRPAVSRHDSDRHALNLFKVQL